MIKKIRIFLWGIIAELEYHLYPWKTTKPPQWAIDRHNLDNGVISDLQDDYLYFEWLKTQEQKIQKIEKNINFILDEIEKLKK